MWTHGKHSWDDKVHYSCIVKSQQSHGGRSSHQTEARRLWTHTVAIRQTSSCKGYWNINKAGHLTWLLSLLLNYMHILIARNNTLPLYSNGLAKDKLEDRRTTVFRFIDQKKWLTNNPRWWIYTRIEQSLWKRNRNNINNEYQFDDAQPWLPINGHQQWRTKIRRQRPQLGFQFTNRVRQHSAAADRSSYSIAVY